MKSVPDQVKMKRAYPWKRIAVLVGVGGYFLCSVGAVAALTGIGMFLILRFLHVQGVFAWTFAIFAGLGVILAWLRHCRNILSRRTEK